MQRRFLSVAVFLSGILLLAVVWYLDRHTPAEVRLTIFYLVPVGFTAWFSGAPMGFVFSLLSAMATMEANWTMVDSLSSPNFYFWNGAIALGTFLVVAVFSNEVARLRRMKTMEASAKRAAEEAARFKSYVVSLVNHEFANALTLLMGALAVMKVTEPIPVPEKRLRSYKVFNRVISGLRGATMNFLNLDRLDSGGFRPEIRRTMIRPLIEKVLASFESLISSSEITLEVSLPPDGVAVRADPDALWLVLTNLVHNAVKYSSSGGKVSVKVSSAMEGALEISVADTGIGISPKDQKLIFAGFYRSREAKLASAQGFGVGLKVSHDLLKAQQSDLKLDSAVGEGSRFYFSLPLWWD
jgi:signal transduction histidine kinase